MEKLQTNYERKTTHEGQKERCVLNSGELVVQRLSSSVSGKAQKYSTVGPREFVSFPYEEMTINNIKSVCEKHFSSVTESGLVCDVVAREIMVHHAECWISFPIRGSFMLVLLKANLKPYKISLDLLQNVLKKHRIRLVVHRPKQTRGTNRKSTT